MKNTLYALVAFWMVLPVAGRAQNSESLIIAADQALSMNKLDDLMGRAQKALSYIMTNLGELADGNNANDSFDKFKDNLDDLQGIRDDCKYRDWETDRKSTRLNSSHRL